MPISQLVVLCLAAQIEKTWCWSLASSVLRLCSSVQDPASAASPTNARKPPSVCREGRQEGSRVEQGCWGAGVLGQDQAGLKAWLEAGRRKHLAVSEQPETVPSTGICWAGKPCEWRWKAEAACGQEQLQRQAQAFRAKSGG